MELLCLPEEHDVDAGLRAVTRALANRRADGGWLRVEVPLTTGQSLDWLAAQAVTDPFAWLARDGGLQVVGHGVAAQRTGPLATAIAGVAGLMRELAGGPPRLRWYGGLGFADGMPGDDTWRGVPDWQFTLPRLEIGTDVAGSWLAVHASQPGLVLPAALQRQPQWPRLVGHRHVPDASGWQATGERALAGLHAHRLTKVVLARRTDLRFEAPVPPLTLLARLAAADPATFRFCLPLPDGAAFVGASPERLFALKGDSVATEALAGTTARLADALEDDRCRRMLLQSPKDLLEHSVVVRHVVDTLASACESVSAADRPGTVTLSRVHHLFTPIHGRLRKENAESRAALLLAAIHPTPAVCGLPRALAHDFLLQHEPFERHYYAAPIGWLGSQGAEFAVGIRSALVRDDSVHAFTGAGFVPGSRPAAEWRELDAKLASMLQALGADLAPITAVEEAA